MGLRFKSSARYANDEVIIEETERLYRELLELSKGEPIHYFKERELFRSGVIRQRG